MWNKGTIEIANENETTTTCQYWVKHFEEQSETYGIDGGRISKLTIRVNGRYTLDYDRGWNIEPEDEATWMVYASLLNAFN